MKKNKFFNKLKPGQKKLISIAGIVVLLFAAVGVGVLVQLAVRQTTSAPKDPFELLGPTLPATVSDVQDLRSEGKTDEATKKLDEALNNPSLDNDTRYQLYIQQGHTFFDQQNWSAAIESYQKAEAVTSTMETAELLAEAYASAGDNAKAIEYFRKAITLIPSDLPFKETQKESYELRIRELGGQP